MATVEVDSTPELEAALHDAIRAILEQKAYEVENVAKRLVHSGGGGKTYLGGFAYRKFGKLFIVPGRGVAHTAGVAGGPPASDTGALANSIHHTIGSDGDGLVARVGSDLRYAGWVELGTKLAPPHPYLRPALYSVTG